MKQSRFLSPVSVSLRHARALHDIRMSMPRDRMEFSKDMHDAMDSFKMRRGVILPSVLSSLVIREEVIDADTGLVELRKASILQRSDLRTALVTTIVFPDQYGTPPQALTDPYQMIAGLITDAQMHLEVVSNERLAS